MGRNGTKRTHRKEGNSHICNPGAHLKSLEKGQFKKKNPREGKKLKTPNSVEMKTEKQQNKASPWKR